MILCYVVYPNLLSTFLDMTLILSVNDFRFFRVCVYYRSFCMLTGNHRSSLTKVLG